MAQVTLQGWSLFTIAFLSLCGTFYIVSSIFAKLNEYFNFEYLIYKILRVFGIHVN